MPVPVQPNTSATGGPLLPGYAPAPLEDKALEDFFQAYVAALTGLAPTLVFPRWQLDDEPNLPAYGTNWAAVGIVDTDPDQFAAILHNGSGQGSDTLQRHEDINLMASFYGPNARGNAALFDDAMQVPQNREVLTLNHMGYKKAQRLPQVPALIKQRWTTRVDVSFTIRRSVHRTYPVLNVESFQATVSANFGTSIPVTEPVIAPYPNQGE